MPPVPCVLLPFGALMLSPEGMRLAQEITQAYWRSVFTLSDACQGGAEEMAKRTMLATLEIWGATLRATR